MSLMPLINIPPCCIVSSHQTDVYRCSSDLAYSNSHRMHRSMCSFHACKSLHSLQKNTSKSHQMIKQWHNVTVVVRKQCCLLMCLSGQVPYALVKNKQSYSMSQILFITIMVVPRDPRQNKGLMVLQTVQKKQESPCHALTHANSPIDFRNQSNIFIKAFEPQSQYFQIPNSRHPSKHNEAWCLQQRRRCGTAIQVQAWEPVTQF